MRLMLRCSYDTQTQLEDGFLYEPVYTVF
jgi:hypothetical protein